MPSPSRYRLPSPQVSLPELARIVSDIRVGRLDIGGSVVLASGTTTTLVKSNLIGPETIPVLVATSSTGAALNWWLSARGKGELTLGHGSPGSDQTFLLLLIG